METLVSKYIDGTITAEEGSQLNAWLKENPEALRKFTEQVLFSQEISSAIQAQAQQQAASAFLQENIPAPNSIPHPQISFWRNWRPISLAASIGILIGTFSSPSTWAFTAERRIWTESFEGMPTNTSPGIPKQPAVWSGDEAQMVQAENGVKPKSGLKMLRFLSASYPGENSSSSSWSDVYRLVDVRDLGGPITERTAIRFSAHFTAVPSPPSEKYQFSVALYALENVPPGEDAHLRLPSILEASLATGSRIVPITAPGTWQELSQELVVPPETRFVLIHISMVKALPKRSSGVALFTGHYVDDLRLDLMRKRSH